jgi:hypothetical protein
MAGSELSGRVDLGGSHVSGSCWTQMFPRDLGPVTKQVTVQKIGIQ